MARRTLPQMLALLPTVYGQLEVAQHPGSTPTDGVRVSGGGGEGAPAPVSLEVTEHRHRLVRGLRWWVDAVGVDAVARPVIGHDVAKMCAWLLGHLDVMAAEDRHELGSNLAEWLSDAWPLVGDIDPPKPPLPLEALDQVVTVGVAARALGVSVSTVKRRAAARKDGRLVLRDAAGEPCPFSDLPPRWCDHCAASAHDVTLGVAQ